MKIAFIGQKGIPARFGGVEAHVEALATRLAKRGHDVEVYVRSWYTEPGSTHYQGVYLHHLPTIRTKHLDATVHSFLATVNGLLRHHDIFHFHAVGPGSFACLPSLVGIPAVVTVHSLDWERAKWAGPAKALMRLGASVAIRSASEVIAVSSELADYVHRHHGRGAHLIPNGVELPDPDRVPESDLLRSLKLEPNRYLLFLGRFVPEKRLEWLLDALRELGRGDLALVLAGETGGSYASSIRERAQGLRCAFPGVVHGGDKEALFRGARLAVLPSELEGLPIFLLEAMARGLPCLASDLPPHRELLGEGRGFLFERQGELAVRLDEALGAGEDERLAMAKRARRYVESHHDWDRVVDATEEVYTRLVKEQREVA